ncbi:hypothetical protein [Mycobacterium sp. OTB74]|uniref:hypothetical protein n=1 Tax=Mycobacterium sp. OTB74 TaxID=1853452 RepID=UPI0024740C95|nr:hypothetical protein [Mycobacterium sp. OTB74]
MDWADDPSSVVEVVHDGFNADDVSGGYAFLCDRGLFVADVGGGSMWSVAPDDYSGVVAEIEKYWRQSQHRNRTLLLDDVSVWHRAAIAALVRGLGSVADVPAAERPGVTDTARADYVLISLRRHTPEPAVAAALRALAGADWLLAEPDEHRRAHSCPLCGLPAIGRAWQYLSVCDDCYPKTVCGDGRKVSGHNTSVGGGFEALHVDDGSTCEQVSRDGRVWIEHKPCRMGEAKFGGVYVGVTETE